jgi:uncharacterized protein (TIGR03083 family)
MTETPPYADLLALVDERSAALREAVAAAGDTEAHVPGCPEWSLRDLVSHLGSVQRFWAAIVLAGPADEPPPRETIGDTEPHGELLEWSVESTRLLLAALRQTDSQTPCWTWWPTSDASQTVAAVARHQVEEAAVHAWDAQETIGKPEPIPAAAAVDGVAEFLQVTYGAEGAWPHRPARVTFACIEGPSFVLDLGPTGAHLDPAVGGEPVATVRGSASDILLALFGRVPLESLTIDGDSTVVDQLRSWGDTN